MSRALAILLISTLFAGVAHAASSSETVTLSLFRAVRLSNTSITLSFKTDSETTGQVRYSQPGGSEIQLTDAAPQVDHLFTITELDPNHGYSFTISASTNNAQSDDYVVLLAPGTIGQPGESIVPAVQVMGSDGMVIQTMLAASATPSVTTSFVPWWAFLILFIVVIGTWVGYRIYERRRTSPHTHSF